MTTPTQGKVCNTSAKTLYGEPCTKFQVSSFSHSGDILGGNTNLNGSYYHNHAPFRDDLSSMCWDWLRFSSVQN